MPSCPSTALQSVSQLQALPGFPLPTGCELVVFEPVVAGPLVSLEPESLAPLPPLDPSPSVLSFWLWSTMQALLTKEAATKTKVASFKEDGLGTTFLTVDCPAAA